MTSGFRTAAEPGTPTILVIDDEESMRSMLVEALGDQGYAVVTAADGDSAVLKVQAARFDIVLCDLKMPGIDGIETIKQIRAIDPDIEVIIITGHGTLEGAIEGLRHGAFDFLQKPLVLRDLFFSIGKALERRDLLERLGLFELSRTIFSTLEPDDLYRRVVQSAIQVLRGDDASLMLLDGKGTLQIALSTSLQQEILDETHLAMGERIAGRVALQPEPVVINEDAARDERFAGVTPMRPISASIVCPLTMRGELLGVLNVNRVKIPGRYTEHDRRNAMILSSLVALALGNARLHNELQARLKQLGDTQEEVIQSEKMTALGNLLSGVAHELNNPLCGILGYAQLLQQSVTDPKVRKGIEVIVREGDRAARIVSNLLTFARREKVEKKPLGLNGVIMKTLEKKAYDLKVSRIEVKADLDPRLPFVLGDFHQLQVVLGHLITNAQQAMFEANGGGVLEIRSERRQGTVVVTLSDNGPGIPAEHVRRIFDPFFTTKEVGKGTGLGLSVSQAIMRDHGGMLKQSGKPGRGATFILELPEAPPETVEAAAPAAASAGAGQPEALPPAGPRILVADAEAHVLDLLVELLRGMGYRVDTAESADGALAKVRAGVYDALIADYALPHLSGKALLDILRAEKPSLARRVIFLASDTADPRLLEFATVSGSFLLGKPFDLETMREAIRRVLDAPRAERATVH